jgi:hypothetical protein
MFQRQGGSTLRRSSCSGFVRARKANAEHGGGNLLPRNAAVLVASPGVEINYAYRAGSRRNPRSRPFANSSCGCWPRTGTSSTPCPETTNRICDRYELTKAKIDASQIARVPSGSYLFFAAAFRNRWACSNSAANSRVARFSRICASRCSTFHNASSRFFLLLIATSRHME